MALTRLPTTTNCALLCPAADTQFLMALCGRTLGRRCHSCRSPADVDAMEGLARSRKTTTITILQNDTSKQVRICQHSLPPGTNYGPIHALLKNTFHQRGSQQHARVHFILRPHRRTLVAGSPHPSERSSFAHHCTTDTRIKFDSQVGFRFFLP